MYCIIINNYYALEGAHLCTCGSKRHEYCIDSMIIAIWFTIERSRHMYGAGVDLGIGYRGGGGGGRGRGRGQKEHLRSEGASAKQLL